MIHETPVNCLIIGAGGVGVVMAYSLLHNGRARVALVSRSDYDKVNSEGYILDSCDYGLKKGWKPHELYRSVDEAALSGTFYSYVIVSTKNIPDGPPSGKLSEVLRPVIVANQKIANGLPTTIILVQNGIDIEVELLEEFPASDYNLLLLSGIQRIASTKVASAHIWQQGQDNMLLGPFNSQDHLAKESVFKFISMYLNEGCNEVKFDANVRYSRWRKLLFNACIGTISALAGLDLVRCMKFSGGMAEEELMRPAMKEIIAIAKSDGITLNEESMDEFIDGNRFLLFKPSICVDLEMGRLVESEVIVGNPLKIARKNGIHTPTLSLIYTFLIMQQCKIKEKLGLLVFDEKICKTNVDYYDGKR